MASDGKKKNDEVKKKRPKTEITPEYIAEQRALREKRKAEKRKAQEEAGIFPDPDPETNMNLDFIHRPILNLPHASHSPGSFKIMTYNVLAQCLIRRELFPENGDALKWKIRSKVLLKELQLYRPDILCLQEVDKDKASSFWQQSLEPLGLSVRFSTFPGKPHGNIIAYNSSLFTLEDESSLSYDDEVVDGVPPQIVSRNTAMFLRLGAKNGPGLIVGTTHLFWHPVGSYERTRQMALFLNRATELNAKFPEYATLLAGDFNSECFDGPYMYATGHTISPTSDTYDIMKKSANHKFKRGVIDEDTLLNDEDDENSNFSVENETERKLEALQSLFKSTHSKLISLYGEHYKSVHPENVHPRSENEPNFSNWAHSWRGLLDYIFFLKREEESPVDIEVSGLLRLPEPHEMGPEPSGQPRLGQYPSDHLSLMATVNLIDKRK